MMKENNHSITTCGKCSFKSVDDLYMTKFDCCFKCYIQYVEGREERWKKGWRPNDKKITKKLIKEMIEEEIASMNEQDLDEGILDSIKVFLAEKIKAVMEKI